jgi:hypothetical protein
MENEMFVYVVIWTAAYEGSELLGVFSDYAKAREFEVNYRSRYAVSDCESEWVEVRKVELDKVYAFGHAGEVL